MVHKSNFLPGFSKFIDENILSHYAPTSAKRILAAGAISLYLKRNEGIIDAITSNSMFSGLGVTHENGMVDLDVIRDVMKQEIQKAGFMRMSFPILGDIDFTTEDVDSLYRFIVNSSNLPQTSQPSTTGTLGVY
jgi:hypothetical protein